jgi:hypothetical protein
MNDLAPAMGDFKMKKTLILLFCLVLAIPLFADLKISTISGKVQVFHNDQWLDAHENMELQINDKVKTLENSYAVLIMNDKTTIWVKQDSEMQVTSIGENSYFDLFFGKIRAKVTKLSGNKKFKVKTPVSVASIRGTDFVTSSEGDLTVLEGQIHYSDAMEQKFEEVAQGFLAQIDPAGNLVSRQLSPDELNVIVNEWDAMKGGNLQKTENNTEEKSKKDDKSASLRQELRDMVLEVKAQINQTREITNEIKDSDLSTGRTLRDVHGNLVRVEQDMLRPDNSTIQILNITKRPDGYNYSNRIGWGYNGPSGSRLDVLEIKMTMNMPLPDQITEWPTFISSKGDALHPQTFELDISNQYDEIKNVGIWKLKNNLQDNLDEKGQPLTEDRLVFTGTINGWKIDPNYSDQNAAYANVASGYKTTDSNSGSDSGALWGWAVTPMFKIIDPANSANSKLVRIGTEGYAIDNSGSILNINNFTNSNDNPFTVLKQIAGEEIIFCREVPTVNTTYQSFASNTDFFKQGGTGGNLDLIITPDLAIAVAEKLVNQISNLQKSNNN